MLLCYILGTAPYDILVIVGLVNDVNDYLNQDVYVKVNPCNLLKDNGNT